MLEVSQFNRHVWSDLASYTEAAWVRRALAGESAVPNRARERRHHLVCRPNLDLHTGMTGVYRHRHANLRRDGGEALLGRALEHAPVSQEEIYFGNDGASLPELAARFGESDGAQVYFELESIRYLWLDRANNAVFEERERRDSDPRRPA